MGEYSLQKILQVAKAQEKKRKAYNPSEKKGGDNLVLKRLEKKKEWLEIYDDPDLRREVIKGHPKMRESLFYDVQEKKEKETSAIELIIDYLADKPDVTEYPIEKLKEKYLLIDWLACQLLFRRPVKTKQLFIYGEPSTQKTLMLHLIAKVVRVYYASSRRNDYVGANDYFDL